MGWVVMNERDLHRIGVLSEIHLGNRTIVSGATLILLPKYSPDLNPIEQVFAKFKHLLRKARARTYDAIVTAIAQLLGAFTAEECRNYLVNSGYDRN
jgi:transposase